MLSYQHMYHAGNQADIQKHAILSLLLARLTQKDKPLTYMETHAGRGIYDLSAPEALKTNESSEGIFSLLKKKKLSDSHPYLSLIQRLHHEVAPFLYPGSPFIAEALLRPTDDIILMELHPAEYKHLRHFMHYDNVHIHHRDGYEGVIALSPPKKRRGLILIDPSYEEKSEFEQVTKTVLKIAERWSQASIMIWYPLLSDNPHAQMIETLKNENFPSFFKQEVLFKNSKLRMMGSGVIIIRTPFGIETELNSVADLF